MIDHIGKTIFCDDIFDAIASKYGGTWTKETGQHVTRAGKM